MMCVDCPRACNVDRETGAKGFCGGGKFAYISKIVPRFAYEEPCLGKTVTAVFFGGCSLGCSYCQNYKISRAAVGTEYSDAELASLFDGAGDRIDLVTPTHYLTAIERALPFCKKSNSLIYNTSGYETVSGINRAAAFSDVFLTDFKYADCDTAKMYSRAADYSKVARRALVEMRKTKDEWIYADGLRVLRRGLIVRHLVLPGHIENSLHALDIIANEIGTDTVLSLMSQFTPNGVGAPDRSLKRIEYKIVAEHALKLGFSNGYFQEYSSADNAYTPDFRCE